MAFDNSFTAVTGATYTAAQYNTYTKGNLTAIWVYTTAGDIVYATSATALARLGLTVGGILYGGASAPAWLAKPSVTSFLQNDNSGVPSWVSSLDVFTGALHTKGVSDSNSHVSTSSTGTDSPLTLNLTLTRTCTVFLDADITGYNDTVGASFYLYGNVAGVNDGSFWPFNGGQARNELFHYCGYFTGVAAGTVTCKMKYGASAGNSYFYAGRLVAKAYVE